ncbi:hypothetical protein BLA39750_01290 [Burkholderia lata]|uniref:Uncharacterized protein n=1 Tax=Burkholderia lata (strain ATCC 17760 / DSM 23089 / LMG 22485 / NCIMB 9086 / R18194 / 383) TaxID=482957 RepID=A0A6P2UXH0_BURL3|nr:hypothetical protein [Burkholderia lata]VWC82267.1 hypothetical protein BLA39750_01290 [Burkholderia lata]
MTQTDTPLHLDASNAPERCLWLLDRNLVEWIMQSQGTDPKLDDAKLTALAELSSIDRHGSIISPLLSIIEGEHGQFDTVEEKLACLKLEVTAIRKFFKVATVDSRYLEEHQDLASQVFVHHREELWTRREIFYRQARGLIKEVPKRHERKHLQEKLITIAAAVELQPADPILVLSIACLHKNKFAEEVLKPKDGSIFNVLSDIHLVGRISAVMAVGIAYDPSLSFGFLTADKGLRGVLPRIRFGIPHITDDGTLSSDLRYAPELFYDLKSEERELLRARLEQPKLFDGEALIPVHTYESITARIEVACHATMCQAESLAKAGKQQEFAIQRTLAAGLVSSWRWLTKGNDNHANWDTDRQRLHSIAFPESTE